LRYSYNFIEAVIFFSPFSEHAEDFNQVLRTPRTLENILPKLQITKRIIIDEIYQNEISDEIINIINSMVKLKTFKERVV
jgi:hypothetical protein